MAQKSRILLVIGFLGLAFGQFVQDQSVFVGGLLLVAIGMILQAISVSKAWYNRTADIVLFAACLVAVIFTLRDNDVRSQAIRFFLVLGFLSQAVAIGVNLITNRKHST